MKYSYYILAFLFTASSVQAQQVVPLQNLPSIPNSQLDNMARDTVKLQPDNFSAEPEDRTISSLSEITSPAAGDFMLCESSAGELSKCDVGDLPTSSGDVTAVATPVDNQIAIWTTANAIEGQTGLTYDGATLTITGNIAPSAIPAATMASGDKLLFQDADNSDIISYESVTLNNLVIEDFADGTAGELITWDATGTPAAVPAGTEGHVLTAQAAGQPPQFAALSGSGITSLEGQTGASQTFADDTNVTIVSSGDVHTVTWAGLLDVTRGGTGVGTSTGTGSVVLNNSPALITPNLGVPSSLTLTNATALPFSTGLTGQLDPTTQIDILTAAAGYQMTVDEAGTALEYSLASKYLPVRKGSAGSIAKGTPVYIDGYNASGFVEVEIADQALVSGEMPAVGLAFETITNTGPDQRVIMSGLVTGLDTTAYAVKDRLYVAAEVGAGLPWLTNTKPTSGEVQALATVTRSHVSLGTIVVHGASRANDVPPFSVADRYWYGGTSGAVTEGTITAAGRAILDDADNTAQVTTLGIDTDIQTATIGASATLSGSNTGDETQSSINALGITSVGTVTSGTWQGTAINQTYLVGQSGTNTGDESQHMIIRIDDGATLAVADDVEVIGIQTAITITTAKLWCAITPVTTSITVDITDDATTILSGFLEVEPTEFDSDDAAPAVTVSSGSIVANSKLAVNVETTGTGTTGGGCSIWIEYNET